MALSIALLSCSSPFPRPIANPIGDLLRSCLLVAVVFLPSLFHLLLGFSHAGDQVHICSRLQGLLEVEASHEGLAKHLGAAGRTSTPTTSQEPAQCGQGMQTRRSPTETPTHPYTHPLGNPHPLLHPLIWFALAAQTSPSDRGLLGKRPLAHTRRVLVGAPYLQSIFTVNHLVTLASLCLFLPSPRLALA